jgi:hypothetical protein
MTTFQCPKCHRTTEALAKDVSHRCPAFRNQYVKFEVVPKQATTK